MVQSRYHYWFRIEPVWSLNHGRIPDLSHRFEAESVGRALELVGERWTLLILREAFFGVRRFGQLARNLTSRGPRFRRGCGCWSTLACSSGSPIPGIPSATSTGSPSRPRSVRRDRRPHAMGRRASAAPRGPADRAAPPHLRRDRRPAPHVRPCGEEITAHNVTPSQARASEARNPRSPARHRQSLRRPERRGTDRRSPRHATYPHVTTGREIHICAQTIFVCR